MSSLKLKSRRNTMLILMRQVGQIIRIGDNITITICGVQGHQVRIGIDAPKEIPVHREEIYKKIQTEKNVKMETINNED